MNNYELHDSFKSENAFGIPEWKNSLRLRCEILQSAIERGASFKEIEHISELIRIAEIKIKVLESPQEV